MYKDLSKKIFDKLHEENLINANLEQEALYLISCILSNNLGLEECLIVEIAQLENIISCYSKVKYHNKMLDIENYYCDGEKIIVAYKSKEYEIYNDLGLYVVEDFKDYIEIFDVVEQ